MLLKESFTRDAVSDCRKKKSAIQMQKIHSSSGEVHDILF